MPEPRWVVELNNYDRELAVAGFWPSGACRGATTFADGSGRVNTSHVKRLKAELRAWYAAKQQRRRLLLA